MGYFAREARARGARQVVGVDLSRRMLRQAREHGNDPGITYVQSSLEAYEPEAATFNLVVARCLMPGGRFALSVEHPIYTANGTGAWNVAPDGSLKDWPVDRYRNEGERRRHWFVDDVLRYHRTVETYVNTLLDAGLTLVRLEEPEAEPALLARHPALREERRRPSFLLLAADRPRIEATGNRP